MEPEEGGADAAAKVPERCVREGGMSLHADVALPARDRRRLERLSRYILRPPICLDRLEAQPDGRFSPARRSVQLQAQDPFWRDGTTHILMERHELLERLAPLIPPPRAHQVRFHGILAPCASGRDQVVPGARLEANTASASDEGHREAPCGIDRTRTCQPPGGETGPTASIAAPEGGAPSAGTKADPSASQGTEAARAPGLAQQAAPYSVPSTHPRRLPWADLLQRVFGIQALQCECGKSMRVLAATATVRIAAASSPPPSPSPRLQSASSTAWTSRPGPPLSRRHPHRAPLRIHGSRSTLQRTSTRRPRMMAGL